MALENTRNLVLIIGFAPVRRKPKICNHALPRKPPARNATDTPKQKRSTEITTIVIIQPTVKNKKTAKCRVTLFDESVCLNHMLPLLSLLHPRSTGSPFPLPLRLHFAAPASRPAAAAAVAKILRSPTHGVGSLDIALLKLELRVVLPDVRHVLAELVGGILVVVIVGVKEGTTGAVQE